MTGGPRLTRKEKRELRQHAKKLTNERKKARLLARPEYQQTPRLQESLEHTLTPRIGVDPGSIMDKLMGWSDENADVDGIWSWGQNRQWDKDDWGSIIYPNLCDFAKLTWGEIHNQMTGEKKKRRRKHHNMDVCTLVPEACKRWEEIGLDQYETSFRFRLSGEKRLWGYRIHARFFLVWWDKFHKIYPSD